MTPVPPGLPLLALGQAGSLSFIHASTVSNAILAMLQNAQVMTATRDIGYALLALFALLEFVRLWAATDTRGLVVLAFKVAIINYFISPGSPIPGLLRDTYGYFIKFGGWILYTMAADQTATLDNALAQMNPFQVQSLWGLITHPASTILIAFVFLLYLAAFGVVFALYSVSILGSQVLVILSILLSVLLFPLILYHPMHAILDRWVTTTMHAMLLPVIGAFTLAAGLQLGLVSPINTVVQCAQQATDPSLCAGGMMYALVTAIIGAFTAVFLMLGINVVVMAYVGGPKFGWTAAAVYLAGRGAGAVGGGRPASVPGGPPGGRGPAAPSAGGGGAPGGGGPGTSRPQWSPMPQTAGAGGGTGRPLTPADVQAMIQSTGRLPQTTGSMN